MEMKLFFPLILLLLYVGGGTMAATTRCPNCGSTPVPFPFSTQPDCGDQLYKVRCDSSKTLRFDGLNGSTYTITSISPETQRLVIRPASFEPNMCVTTDLSSDGFQLNSSLPFNITSSNTVMYLNCSELALSSPVNCSPTSLCHSYINGSAEGAVCLNAPICCTFRAGGSTTSYRIRARNGRCTAYRSFVNLEPLLPVNRWPEPGVELGWAPPREPLCQSQSDCGNGSNSTCGPDQLDPGRTRCFCVAGLWWDSINGVCAKIDTCQNPGGCNKSTNHAPLIAGLTSGLGVALLAIIVGFFIYKRNKRIKETRERLTREREEILNANNSGRSAKVFTGKEIKKATNNFAKDRILGSGGFGDVYMGMLDDGTQIAVKCAKLGNAKGVDQILNEVRILCQVNHRCIARLLGCCVELQQPILVYEYISNGALYEHLRGLHPGKQSLIKWRKRLSIAHQTAEGLTYLHSSAVPPIYHRDVKSSNILLDEKLNAKVADFGISRLAETDLSHISTCAQGTLGYLDPEYYRNYQLTDKSDVYSYGVVLLELLTSMKAIDFNRGEYNVNLAIYIQQMVEEDRLLEAIDPMLMEGASTVEIETMKALALLALGCLNERRQNRPSMKEVAEEIQYIMSIETVAELELGC